MGNPGTQYSLTRHNVGFRTLDLLAEQLSVSFKKSFFNRYSIAKVWIESEILYLVKPLTFMNRSGDILYKLLKTTGIDRNRIVVVCDTLDLPPGMCRLKKKGSSAGHGGLKSIIAALGDENFMRLYIGVGRPVNRDDVIKYVLNRPRRDQAELIDKALLKAAECILCLLSDEPEKVMNVFNKKDTG